VDSGGPLAYLLECDAEEVPVTQDNRRCPRIEVRDGNSAVVFVGVPSGLNANYFAVPEALKALVDGRPTGRACFDCVPHGLDKSLVVAHLLETGVAVAGRTVACGDQPGGNDDGLTRWHRHPEQDVPFISVSEHRSMVPEHLRECHLTAASNAEGSALVLSALADRLDQDGETLTTTSEGLCALVRKINDGGAAACA